MINQTDRRDCTRAERAVLDMIECWPGVPALVTMSEDGRWSVSTPEGWEKAGTVGARADAAFGPLPETRPVSHKRAEIAARRLIHSHFGSEDRARITVPPRVDQDDDFILVSYIRQQQSREAPAEDGSEGLPGGNQ